jgi:hypothetical protein
MSVSYASALKTTRMTAVQSAIDVNASPATIEIGTASMAATLVTITLAKPSFSTSADTITMLGVPKSGTASGTGTAANARIKDGGGNIIVSNLTVGTTASDIILSSTAITSGQTVTISSGTIQHSP